MSDFSICPRCADLPSRCDCGSISSAPKSNVVVKKTPSLVDRIRLAREGSAVERCHVQPHLLRYSVGHHSLDMITLIILTWQAAHDGILPRSELLVAAAFHDIPECVIGDHPSPIKDLMDSDRVRWAEGHVLAFLGVGVMLTDEEKQWLQVCDRLELSLWSMEEGLQRGNRSFDGWAVCDDDAPSVFLEVYRRMTSARWPRLTWQELREVAGL